MQEIVSWFLYIISIIFTYIIYNICYVKLNNAEFKLTFYNLMNVVVTCLLVLLNNSYNNLWLKFIIVPIITCISFKLLYHDNWKKVIISYIFIFLITIVIEFVLTNLLNFFGILNSYILVISITITKAILSIIVVVCECLLISNKYINKFCKKLIDNLMTTINIMNIMYLLYFTIAIFSILNVINFATKDSIKLLLILLILFIVLFALIISLKSKEKVLILSNQKLIEYNTKYGTFLDEYKIYKHNINHKLHAMKAFGNKKINSLIDELVNEENNFDIKNNNLYNIPNGIKGIVAEKLYNANIEVIINNNIKFDPFKTLSPKLFNSISECLGIALDNAVEACKETNNPIITMDLFEKKEIIYIKIGNNFKNSIDLNKLGEKYYSTKNRGSGLGLFSIMRNKAVKEKISIINNFYYIELQVKKAR